MHQTSSPWTFLIGALLAMIVAFGVIIVEIGQMNTGTPAPVIIRKTFFTFGGPAAGTNPTPIPTIATVSHLNIPILLYHYVETVKDARPKLDVTPKIFEAQLTSLKEAGYQSLVLRDVVALFEGKMPVPDKAVVLTFDDGYGDFYSDVFPLLKKYNMKATVFIIVDKIGKPNYMTDAQIREISQSGLVEIGSHTLTHKNLKGASQQVLNDEIGNSKTTLSNQYGGIPIISFAYPNGAVDWEAAAAVQASGYGVAVTVSGNGPLYSDKRFTLPRVRPGTRTGKAFIEYIQKESQ